MQKAMWLLLAVLCLLLAAPHATRAQTPTTGVVTGTVTDPTGAVVPGASITLTQPSTGSTLTTTTDAAGHYVFPAVLPGIYTVKATAKGFRTAVVTDLHVQVLKSHIVDLKLEIGEVSELVEVVAPSISDLQTTDASVGEVLTGLSMNRMPVSGRSTSALIFLQPAVTPNTGGDVTGGQIGGARSEQVTFYVDGGDATSDLEGSNNYVSPDKEPGVSPVVPVPLDAAEEFRVSTTNPNSTYGRSSGGQISILTRSGTNAFHGSAYEFHEDSGFDANRWEFNRTGINRPHVVDNRFGGGVGGPILKDKLFFYGFYEGRRFAEAAVIRRVIPTATLKQGVLLFNDGTGVTRSYNFNPASPLASSCGTTGLAACDPRGLGLSPVIRSQFALYPNGNDPTLGDGLNTTGLIFSVPTPISTNLSKLKLSFNLTSKWSGFVTWQYASTIRTGTEQVNIVGTPQAVSGDPYYSNYYTFQIQGQLTPTLISVTHGSFLRNWWAWTRTAPSPLVSGTAAALQVAGEGVGNVGGSTAKLIADPININTQQARARTWNAHDWFIGEDLTWVRGSHTLQFGGSGTIWHDRHLRTDNVLGGLTTGPIYFVGGNDQANNTFVNIPTSFQPPTCTSTLTTNCLQRADQVRWNGLYAAILGLVDHSTQILTRDGNFNPNQLGTPAVDNVTIPSFATYFQDVWKVRPSLTITAGLNWGVQLAPSEEQGKEVVLTYAASGAPVNFQQYFQDRVNALGQGQAGCFPFTTPSPPAGAACFNPTFGLVPVRQLATPFHDEMRVTKWTDIGPRISAAWQVPFTNRIFGNRQTVIRGGYALVFDRISAVNQVLSPLLAGGLADASACPAPRITTPGATSPGAFSGACNNPNSDPTNAFRIGVDTGTVPIPTPTAQSIPFIPGAPNGLLLSFPLDPFATPGYAHSVDVTIQRAGLPGNIFVELGYIGRWSRNLPQAQDVTSAYYLMKDPQSGRTLAQAFDNLATALRGGVSPLLSNGNPNRAFPVDPFFEHLIGPVSQIILPNGQPDSCTPNNIVYTASVFVACRNTTRLTNGDLARFTKQGLLGRGLGLPVANRLNNMQIFQFSGVTAHGYSDYQAGFASVRKTFSQGLQFLFNWTWSHAIGNWGRNQQYINTAMSPYNPNLDKRSTEFDRRHVFNLSGYYELPFGKGRRFATGKGIFDRIVGGWSTSAIWTYHTGLPVCIAADGNYGSIVSVSDCAIPNSGFSLPKLGPHFGVAPSSGAGSAGGGRGSGINAFGNPAAVFAGVHRPLLSVDGRIPADQLRGFHNWNLDFSVGKNLAVTERIKTVLTVDATNVFNHVIFATPSLDLNSAANFGVITAQNNNPRTLQVGLKIEF